MDLIVVLDTNAYSDWRRSGRWHANIAIADRVVIPSIVLGELLHGFEKGGWAEENIAKFDDFLSQPQVELATLTRRTAELYGRFLAHLQVQGTPIPTNDIWISAVAYELNGELATRDAHFEHLPQVRLAREIP
jgi:tRNA(fMet)-specific endonuclease VapC